MYLNGLLFRYELHIFVHVFRVVVTHSHAPWHARRALNEKKKKMG